MVVDTNAVCLRDNATISVINTIMGLIGTAVVLLSKRIFNGGNDINEFLGSVLGLNTRQKTPISIVFFIITNVNT